ncbi:MAG: metallophosphoesterase [Bacilli bacterium]|jgi:predicted MPP superfamily phosphohydrolase
MKKNQVKNQIIVLGDTHGRNLWEKILEKHPQATKVVFLGDYFDSFDIPFKEQAENFTKILALKKAEPERIVLLLGNHDFQYLPYVTEHYSGYQAENRNHISALVDSAVEEGLIKVCYTYKKWVFTHAGITKNWLKNSGGDIKNLEGSINEMFNVHPNYFFFTEGINHDNSGDDITQSPLWVRPHSLIENRIDGWKQVVGHTRQKNIILYDVMFIDTLEFGNEYLIINNDTPSIGQI